MLDVLFLSNKDQSVHVSSKHQKAIHFDAAKRQWADLGNQTHVCLADPATCDAAGGAVGFWMRITDTVFGSVISSRQIGSLHAAGTNCRVSAPIFYVQM